MLRWWTYILLFMGLSAITAVAQVTDTLTLTLNVQNQGNTSAVVAWNRVGDGTEVYHLYRKMPREAGFSERTTTTQQQFTDAIQRIICADTITYYVACQYHDTVFQSRPVGVYFDDPYPTTSPALDIVTVDDSTQQIHFSWEASPDEDIVGYFICHIEQPGAPCLGLDTVWGRENTHYVAERLSCLEVHSFRVYAFDSCFKASALTDGCNNMVLQLTVVDCEHTVTARWNNYENMPGGLGHYVLYAKYDTSDYLPVDTVLNGQPCVVSYDVPDNVRSVRLKVAAISADPRKVAYSNAVVKDFTVADTARFITLAKLSVNDDGSSVSLVVRVDTGFHAQGYTLYRSMDDGAYGVLAHLSATSEQWVEYTDNAIELSEHQYRYRAGVFDACGRNEKYSNEASPMFLQLTKNDDEDALLRWNPYDATDTMAKYYVLRRSESATQWTNLDSTLATTYVDPIGNQEIYETQLYKVLLQVDSGVDMNVQSNCVKYSRDATVWFPNVFTPDAKENNRFCMSHSFITAATYEISVYNRMGQRVFHTNDPGECWDGMSAGRMAPQGAYTYIAYCQHADRTSKYYCGTVLLLR